METARHLEEREAATELVRFTLTGEVPGNSEDDDVHPHQATIDPVRNVIRPEHGISAFRDYDSVIGITSTIVVRTSISVYPIPDPKEVLSTSIHFKYPLRRGEVCYILIMVHRNGLTGF